MGDLPGAVQEHSPPKTSVVDIEELESASDAEALARRLSVEPLTRHALREELGTLTTLLNTKYDRLATLISELREEVVVKHAVSVQPSSTIPTAPPHPTVSKRGSILRDGDRLGTVPLPILQSMAGEAAATSQGRAATGSEDLLALLRTQQELAGACRRKSALPVAEIHEEGSRRKSALGMQDMQEEGSLNAVRKRRLSLPGAGLRVVSADVILNGNFEDGMKRQDSLPSDPLGLHNLPLAIPQPLTCHPIRSRAAANVVKDYSRRRRNSDAHRRVPPSVAAAQAAAAAAARMSRASSRNSTKEDLDGTQSEKKSVSKGNSSNKVSPKPEAAMGSVVCNDNAGGQTPQPLVQMEPAQSSMLFRETRRQSSGTRLDEDYEETPNQMFCRDLVEHRLFDSGVGILILLNSIVIGAHTELTANAHSITSTDFFERVDNCFCLLFVIELSLRVLAYRGLFFVMSGRWWNFLDMALVLMQVFESIVELFFSGSVQTGNLSVMRMLRILRVVRIIRLVRMLRLIAELRTIVVCIMGSLRSLIWTVALLILIIYITAVCMTDAVSEARTHEGSLEDPLLTQYYGSLFRSVLTLYEAIAGGVSWDVAVMPLIQHIHPMTGVLFAFYIAFVLLAIMNVVTGVFVETGMQSAKREEDDYMVQLVRELFALSDQNGNGQIEWEEFEAQLQSPHMEDSFKLIDADPAQAKELFQLLDIEGTGSINFDDFIDGFMRFKGPAKALDLMVVMYEQRRSTRHIMIQINTVLAFLETLRVYLFESDEEELRGDATASVNAETENQENQDTSQRQRSNSGLGSCHDVFASERTEKTVEA